MRPACDSSQETQARGLRYFCVRKNQSMKRGSPSRIRVCRDQVFELCSFALAEIEDVEERTVIFERGHRAFNHIVDVCVIAARPAIAELIDWLASVDASGKLMDRQIGALPRTVNGEIAQRNHAHLI